MSVLLICKLSFIYSVYRKYSNIITIGNHRRSNVFMISSGVVHCQTLYLYSQKLLLGVCVGGGWGAFCNMRRVSRASIGQEMNPVCVHAFWSIRPSIQGSGFIGRNTRLSVITFLIW